MEVPAGEHRSFRFFEKSTVEKYAVLFGWTLITRENMKALFLEMVKTMTMSYSYKPVFLLAFLDNMDASGSARLEDVARDFARYYEARKEKGLPPEKRKCIFTRGGYTPRDVERLILNMPFKRFEDMHIMHHARQLGTLQFYTVLSKQLTEADIQQIRNCCELALNRYFG
jgi:hypothetical protein